MTKLNIGCGFTVLKGFDNLDILTENPDVIYFDFNKNKRLRYEDNAVDYVLMEHIIYYLDNPMDFMKEIWRVCKDGAIVDLVSVHFSLGMNGADLRVKRSGLSYFSFGNIQPTWNREIYGLFEVESKRINFMRYNYVWLNKIINPLINKFPMFYERFLSNILPASEVIFKLKVIKDREKIEKAVKILTPKEEVEKRYKTMERL